MGNEVTVVDTDVIIDFFAGINPAAEALSRLISQGEAVLTAVSVFELYAGVEGKKRLAQIEALVLELAVLPLNLLEAAVAGRIYTQLKKRGRVVGTQDILIGGICVAHNLPLCTKNITHFSGMTDLRMISPDEILDLKDR